MVVSGIGKLNLEEPPPIFGSRTVDCFEKIEQIGEGTYGQVFMAKEIKTGEIVALKKIRLDKEKEGFPITAIREIKILKKLHHENIIQLKEVVTSPGRDKDDQGNPDNNKYKGGIYMVFEYMDHDLTGLVNRHGLSFTIPQIKCYMKQLLTGLHHCHINRVLHRDIKGANLLINNKGQLKLADFGLARPFTLDATVNLTNRVISLWYRPPELLLGTTKYGPEIDIWSVGCLLAELLNGKAILDGKTETEQLNKIYELCGSPNENNWPGVSKMPWYTVRKTLLPFKRRLREIYKHFDRHALDLLDKMLVLDPSQRISARDALDAKYFWNHPLPCDPKSLPIYEPSHEFQIKKERQQMLDNEEAAKKQKLQHPQQNHYPGAPPQSLGAPYGVWQPNYSQGGGSSSGSYPPQSLGAPYGVWQPNYSQGGGSSSGSYPPQSLGAPYGVWQPNYSQGGGTPHGADPRGPSGGNDVRPPNYSQGGDQYGGSGSSQNPMDGNSKDSSK